MEKATRVRLLNPEPKYRFQPNGQRRKCFEVIRRGVNREGIITIRAYVLGCARQGIRSASAHSDLSSLVKHKLVERVNEAYERRLKSEGSLRPVGKGVDLVAEQVYPTGEKKGVTAAAVGVKLTWQVAEALAAKLLKFARLRPTDGLFMVVFRDGNRINVRNVKH